jgi:hypothetical protein
MASTRLLLDAWPVGFFNKIGRLPTRYQRELPVENAPTHEAASRHWHWW